MAGSVNKVTVVGRLGADPRIGKTNNGRLVANMRLATSETWRDKATGERKERTDWHDVVVFNEALAKIAQEYFRKGMSIYVEGQLQYRDYEHNGAERRAAEIVVPIYKGDLKIMDSRNQDGGRRTEGNGDNDPASGNHRDFSNYDERNYNRDLGDDDIPF